MSIWDWFTNWRNKMSGQPIVNIGTLGNHFKLQDTSGTGQGPWELKIQGEMTEEYKQYVRDSLSAGPLLAAPLTGFPNAKVIVGPGQDGNLYVVDYPPDKPYALYVNAATLAMLRQNHQLDVVIVDRADATWRSDFTAIVDPPDGGWEPRPGETTLPVPLPPQPVPPPLPIAEEAEAFRKVHERINALTARVAALEDWKQANFGD
jgi:hypothetical protein